MEIHNYAPSIQIDSLYGDVNIGYGHNSNDNRNSNNEDIIDADFYEVVELTNEEKIVKAIEMLEQHGKITHMYDYAAVQRIIHEKELYTFSTNDEFGKFISNLDFVPVGHKPKASNIKQVAFSSKKFPDWEVLGVADTVNAHLKDVGKSFLDFYLSL